MDLPVLVTIAITVLAASALLTGLVRRFLLARRLLAMPNERSSHKVPTPQGGGIAIVAATTVALGVLAALGTIATSALLAFVGGGTAVAVIGYLDDVRHVSPRARFAVHLAAALWALFWLGGLPPIPIGAELMSLGAGGY